jgi:hypothetical protein
MLAANASLGAFDGDESPRVARLGAAGVTRLFPQDTLMPGRRYPLIKFGAGPLQTLQTAVLRCRARVPKPDLSVQVKPTWPTDRACPGRAVQIIFRAQKSLNGVLPSSDSVQPLTVNALSTLSLWFNF